MPALSKKSQERLAACHPDLQKIFIEVASHLDVTIIEGLRTKERQEELVRTGKSKTMDSKHLKHPDGYSHAVDCGVWLKDKIEWDDVRYYFYLAGLVKAIAAKHGVTIRWGGDWDSDTDFSDQTFNDYVHFEIK